MKFTIGQITLDFSNDSFKVSIPIQQYELSVKIVHLPETERPLSVELNIWQLFEGKKDA